MRIYENICWNKDSNGNCSDQNNKHLQWQKGFLCQQVETSSNFAFLVISVWLRVVDDTGHKTETIRRLRSVMLPEDAKHTSDRWEDQQIYVRTIWVKTSLSMMCYKKILGYIDQKARRQPDILYRLIVVGKLFTSNSSLVRPSNCFTGP